jgi:hypothetical protein
MLDALSCLARTAHAVSQSDAALRQHRPTSRPSEQQAAPPPQLYDALAEQLLQHLATGLGQPAPGLAQRALSRGLLSHEPSGLTDPRGSPDGDDTEDESYPSEGTDGDAEVTTPTAAAAESAGQSGGHARGAALAGTKRGPISRRPAQFWGEARVQLYLLASYKLQAVPLRSTVPSRPS